MKAPKHLPPTVAAVWTELVTEHGTNAGRILGPEFEAYCATITNLRDAQRRIHDEQIIVPDSKNAPVAHPALAIERQAMDDLRKWGGKFRPRI